MPRFVLDKFLGLFTRAGRSVRPVGALDDVQNYVLNNKMDKLVLRSGYSTDITGAITSTDGTTMATVQNYYKFSTENPSANYQDLLIGADGSSNKFFFQRGYFHNSSSIDSSSFFKWGESLSTTISLLGPGSNHTFGTLASGNAIDDYYNGWLLYNTTRNTYSYITDYVGSTKVATFLEVLGGASGFIDGDSFIVYR